MSNITKCFLLITAIAVFNSCKQPNSPETATIQGRVELAQTYWMLTPPYNGVLVTIEGTNFSALTDDSGYFSFQGVPTGSYNVHFSKLGYGDIYWMSETVTGGGNAPQYWYSSDWVQPLYKISNVVTTLNSVDIKDTTLPTESNTTYLVAKGNITPDPSLPQLYQSMVVYISHTSDVSDVPGHYTTYFFSTQLEQGYDLYPFDTTSGTFTFGIPGYNLTSAGFKSGDSIYVAAYGSPTYGANSQVWDYYNPTLNQYVLTALNPTPSPIIGTKMP